MPIAKVFVKPAIKSGEVISVTACHELLEMLVDPSAALWTDGPHGTVWAYEVCDVVEDDKIDFNGIKMSDFVYPAYFDLFRLKQDRNRRSTTILKRSNGRFRSSMAAIPIFTRTASVTTQIRLAGEEKALRKRGPPLSSQSIPQETA